MSIEIKIPEAGESISEVQIGEWLKSEGDTVEQDEIIVEIETDKASMEIPAPAGGTLAKITKKTGDTAEVGDVIGRIESNGAASKSKEVEAEEEADGDQEASPGEKASEADNDKEERAPSASEKKKEQGDEDAESIPDEVEVRPRVMPAARRALSQHDLRASDIKGTGPAGRVLQRDVRRHVSEDSEQPAPEEGQPPQRPDKRERAAAQGAQPFARRSPQEREEKAVPMSRLRKAIARRLVEVQQSAALLTTFNEIDMTAVLGLRQRYGEAFQDEFDIKLGFMSFFVKASIEALKRIQIVNAEVRGDEIIYRNYFDIGFAVATEHGLVVPVLRDADLLSFAEIERAIDDFAKRARARKVTPDELEGGTFTISNGGVYGSLLSTPIVNPPQSGILGLHAIQERPVARDGEIVIRPMMYVALTYDHRIIDGKEAVTFLRDVKQFVEEPARMLLEM
jgi:2-oxoglutarate dehydrogenase E2 component (dihydrolipoamide succinyltransferase)